MLVEKHSGVLARRPLSCGPRHGNLGDTMVKKLLIGLGVVVLLLVAAALIVPWLVPLETYKEQVAQQIKKVTGRELTVGGDLSFSLLPAVALEARQVRLSNAEWATDADMIALDAVQVRLDLLPLLSGQVVVDSFVLENPVIHLERDARGRANWELGGPKGDAAAGGEGEAAPAEGGEAAGGAPRDIRLGDVRLVNALVTYTDAATGRRMEARDLNLKVALTDLDSPLELDGDVLWNGEKVALSAVVERPRDAMEGRPSPVSLEVTADPVAVSFEGTAAGGREARVDGALDVEADSLRGLIAWVDKPLDFQGEGLEKFSLKGAIAATPQRAAVEGLDLQLDALRASGELAVAMDGPRPVLSAALETNTLDLNPYMPPSGQEGGETAAGEQAAQGQAKPQGWSDEPIDFSGLRQADLDLRLKSEGVVVRKVEIGESVIAVTLKGGRLDLELERMALYDGAGKAKVAVAAEKRVPDFSVQATLDGIQAAPLLTAAADFERLEGTGAFTIDAATRGDNVKAIVGALNGKGGFVFEDGAIRGVNLAAMVRNVTSAFQAAGTAEAQKTDFAELKGSFTIADGVVNNPDTQLLAPLVRLAAAGTVNLPARTLKYRVEPKAVATLEGQGGQEQLAGVMVPVIVEGPWDNLKYRPDLEGAIKKGIQDPGALERTLEGLKDGDAGSAIKGLLGGGDEEPAPAPDGGGETEQQEPASPMDTLRGILGQ